MSFKNITVGLFAALLLISSSAHAANLVTNGDFQAGFTGWTLFGNTGFTGTDASGAILGPIGSDGFMMTSSPINTVGGHQYNFSYTLSNNAGPANNFASYVNFQQVPASVVTNAEPFTNEVFNYIFTASGQSLISFSFMQNPGLFHLTNVSVSEVPVPAALPMFGLALVSLGALAWRRRYSV